MNIISAAKTITPPIKKILAYVEAAPAAEPTTLLPDITPEDIIPPNTATPTDPVIAYTKSLTPNTRPDSSGETVKVAVSTIGE